MKLGVLVSGSGTNLQAILDAQGRGELGPARVAIVISNRPGVRALDRARAANVPAQVIDHRTFETRQSFEAALLGELARAQVDLVVLAGFMRLLTPSFLRAYPDRVVNIHPALLPAFPGVDAPAQAFAYGVRVTGVTVHFVDEGIDSGPIIAQRAVEVLPGDTVETLGERIHAEEHRIYPAVLRALAEGRVCRQGRHVRIAPERTP